MNADEVWDFVCRELGGKRENKFGWNFYDRLLSQPEPREYQESDGSTSTYWTVLIESTDGYHVVFDETSGQFGLAASGTVVGWHGALMTTIDGM